MIYAVLGSSRPLSRGPAATAALMTAAAIGQTRAQAGNRANLVSPRDQDPRIPRPA